MGQSFTWTADVPTGVLKSHAMSAALLKIAALQFKIVPFCTPVNADGRQKGETITLPYYKHISTPANNGQLSESQRMPIDKLVMSEYDITVSEFGRGVQFTRLADTLSELSPKQGAQNALVKQMNECMDNAAAAAFTGANAKVKYIPTTLTGGVFDTDGVASTTALVNITKSHLGAVRDYMANDLHTPTYENDFYIGLCATKACRGLLDDRVLQNWAQYLQKGDFIYKSEVGECERIRIIEITNSGALTNGIGSGSVLGESVVFGEDAVGIAEVETPELRVDPNYQGDFGRVQAVAWYGIVGYGVMFQSADDRECRIVHISSAPN